MSELKPCPFCGEPADGRYQRLAKCCNDKCLMNEWVEDDTLFYLDEDWNTRPIEDALNARITELEAEVTKCHELQDSYCDRIAELEAAQRWVMVSERLPKESGWYLAGLIGWAGGYYTGEVHFDTETGLPWRSPVRDEVFCWLDGVPELPQSPEVQE